ncbi:MAG: amino acid adenylation domain-containing protein, partial [Clostridia bacterium]|nr:amino acid adenylation domain-containing protein [Clostridia bacterium]
ELTEVEEVIRRYEGITDATVAAYDNPAGGKYIAAYICSDEKIDIEKMNDFIRAEKPPYMVPAVTMQIDAIPYNQNLKVNKRALPKPDFSPSEEENAASDRPMTKLEEKLASIAESAAGLKINDVSAPLVNIGLTSLSAISFVTHMEKQLGVDLAVKKILGGYSLLDIENAIVDELFTRDVTEEETAEETTDSKYPLTETQFGIYSECMLNPDSTIYNIPYSYRLDTATGAERLRDAIIKVIDAHGAVKCTVEPDENGDVFMIPHSEREAAVEIIKGSEGERDAYWKTFSRPFDFADTLYRITVYETDKYLYLMIDFHHIMFDGTSLGILLNDLNTVLAGGEIESEAKSIFNFSKKEQKLLKSSEFTEAKSYYDSLLKGSSGCAVPDGDKSEETESAGFERILRSELKADEVKDFCDQNGVTPNAFFLAAAGLVLAKYGYSDDVCLTTVYNGRSDPDTENAFGMFVKTLPLRCFPEMTKTTSEYVREIGKQIISNMSNDLYSFAKISRAYNLSADYMLVYQGEGFGGNVIDGREAVSQTAELKVSKSDISTDVWVEDGVYRFDTEYRANKYSREYIERYTDILATAAKSMLTAVTLCDVNITSQKELETAGSFNETDIPVELVSVNKLFENHVSGHPDMTAVIANGEQLTYGELNSLANRLAHSLRDLGLNTENVVGIVLDRTKEVYICEYGILKAGGAFLPMASEYPDERIDFCLTDANCPFVITTEKIKAERPELFSEDKRYKVLTVESLIKHENDSNLNLEIPASSLAYCIYTSGSTGKPKGVMIEHGNLCNFVDANDKNDETKNLVYPGGVMLGIAAISFDVSIMESFIPLCNGMTACMANDDEIHNPLMLCDLINNNNASVMCATPSFIMNIVDIPEVKQALKHIKAFDLGAEAFPGVLYDKLHGINPDTVIINGYGPTETTISCISKIITSSENITIGKPAANVKAYVMDKQGHVLPAGVSGELVICGKGVGRGYMNLPEKTKEVFFEFGGERAYRSGDLVRYNANGEIEFFGRLDNQVKLRGLRVELDEIENVMNEFDGVLTSKVVVRNNGSEDYLAGFFTAEKPTDIAELSEFMKSKLTAYMVPSAMMQLDEMPLTVNGKIDKKQLPEIEFKSAEREYIAPETELEKELCDKFADILSLDRVGATDNFFEIGGTSLSATKVVMYALTKGYNIVYKDVFDNPEPRSLAAFIGGETKVNEGKVKPTEYDYTEVNTVLKNNIFDRVDEVKPTGLGNIVLTGATGFLGVHVLKAFLDHYSGKVYCLIRRGMHETCEKRMKNMLMYYFESTFDEYFGDRIICIEGDITEKETLEAVKSTDAGTVINCAACVKHFVNDDILDRVNVGGVKNLIDICVESGKKLVQISTTSVAGEGGIEDAERLIHENELYFGQNLDNDYVRTKFLAERAILEARANRGLDGRIMRVGNLMSRLSDGEFQINFVTNGFMRSLRAYKQIGVFPIEALEAPAEFSPIDSTASAILALCASDSEFSVFHVYNDHIINMADVIYAMKDYGFNIEIVDAKTFSKALSEATKDEKMADAVLGLVAYDTNNENAAIAIGSDNRFTKNVLYRLGYKWPITDNKYLANAIEALDTLNFFD